MLKTDRNSCVPNRHRWRRPSRGDITPAYIAKVLVDLLFGFLSLNWLMVTLMIYILAVHGALRGLRQLRDLGLQDFGLLPWPLVILATAGMLLGLLPLLGAPNFWMIEWVDRKLWGERPRPSSPGVLFPPAVTRWMCAAARAAVRFQIWLWWVGLTCFMLSFATVAVESASQAVLSNLGLDIRYGIVAAYAAWVVVTAGTLFMWFLRLQQAATDRIRV